MERFLDMFIAFRIKPDLISSTKESVIEELIDTLFDAGIIDLEKRKAILEAVLEREMIVSTGIGSGLAIPHCHYENIKILSSISEAIGNGDFYQRLLEAETEEKIKEVLNSIPIVTKVEQ